MKYNREKILNNLIQIIHKKNICNKKIFKEKIINLKKNYITK